jgi:hypothetical protein
MQDLYWTGHNFELNVSFATLRDYQWKRLIDALWQLNDLEGPLVERFIPDQPLPAYKKPHYPSPTDTLTLHGVLETRVGQVGIDMLVTRSLFECITISVPTGMLFEDASTTVRTEQTKLSGVFAQYRDIALTLHEVVNFEIASIGWNRECQIVTELETDADRRQSFFERGNFFATDDVLQRLGSTPDDYEEVLPGVRWAAAR